MAVGEHRGSQHGAQGLEVVLALVSVPHTALLPHHGPLQRAVLPHQVLARAVVQADAGVEVLHSPGDGVAGVEVAVGVEGAGQAERVEAPVLTVLLDEAQLLAHAVGALVAGQVHAHDDLLCIRLTLAHREEGALARHQGKEEEEGANVSHDYLREKYPETALF